MIFLALDCCLQIIEQAAMREERNRIAQLMDQLLQQQQQQQQPDTTTQPCTMGQSTAIDDAIGRLQEERSQLQHAVALQVPGLVLSGVCLFTFLFDAHATVMK